MRLPIAFGLLLHGWLGFSQVTCVLSGRVTDEQGQALYGAVVYLHETHQGDVSEEDGTFEIAAIRPGYYHLHITYTGYHAWSGHLQIRSDTSIVVEMHESVNQLHEILVEGNLLQHDHRENPLAATYVSAEYIRDRPSIGLMTALQQLPGISAIQVGAGISKPVIRGMSGNRILVAENGIKQEGQQWGNDHGLELDAYQAEQIEIIRGPSVLMFGGDAMGGVLHVKPMSSGKPGVYESEARGFYQSVNRNLGFTLASKGNNGKWIYRARVTRQQYQDYRLPAREFNYNGYVLPIHGNRLQNTAGIISNVNLSLGLNRDWGYSHLHASVYEQEEGLFSGATGAVRAYELSDDGNPSNRAFPRQHVRHYKLINNTNIMLGKYWLESDMGFQYNHRMELARPHAHGRPIDFSDTVGLELKLSTWQLNARLYLRKSAELTRITGIQTGLQQNRRGGFEFLIPEYRQWQQALFYLEKREWGKWNFTYGARVDFTRMDIDASTYDFYYRFRYMAEVLRNEAFTKNALNYALSAGGVYHLDEHREFRLNFSKSFRMPQVAELASNGVHHGTYRFEQGDAGLRSEQGLMTDIGYNQEFHRYHFSVSGFGNYFFNYIYLQPSGSFATITYDNVIYPYPEPGQVFAYRQAPAWHYGAEAEFGMKINNAIYYAMNAEYAWIRNLNTGRALPFIPPASIQQELSFRHEMGKRWTLKSSLSYGYFFARTQMAPNEPSTPAYDLLGAQIGMTRSTAQGKIEAGLSGNNLLNRLYFNNMSRYRFLNLPEPGRNIQFYLQWKPQWKKDM